MAVVGWTQGLALVVISASCARWDASWPGWPPWAVAAGLTGMTGLVCFYTALSTRDHGRRRADRGARGSSCRSSLGVASGEQPSAWAWVGMVVAIVGVTLASARSSAATCRARPVVLAALAALGFGLALFFIDRGARESTLLTLWGMRRPR